MEPVGVGIRPKASGESLGEGNAFRARVGEKVSGVAAASLRLVVRVNEHGGAAATITLGPGHK